MVVGGQNLWRRYLWGGIGVWGPIYWAGMNIFMSIRHQEPRFGHGLVIWLLATFAGSECLGALVGASMWIRAKRRAARLGLKVMPG